MTAKTLEKRAKTEERLKKSLNQIYDNHHPNQENPDPKPPSVARPQPSSTRNALMLRAKEMKIQNFRVLNKSELAEVTDNVYTEERRLAIVDIAVTRWKAGWSKNKTVPEQD